MKKEILDLPTCAVTVTYGDRFDYLKQVIYGALTAGATKIVAVDNAAAERTKLGLQELKHELQGTLHILTLPTNTGSAGGFKAGIEYASGLADCQFIWLLDDDNLPHPDSLERLVLAYRLLGSNSDNALLSLRCDWTLYVRASNHGEWVGLRPNSFIGFHLCEVPSKIARRIRTRFVSEPVAPRYPLIEVGIAMYGGFWFDKSWVQRIGLPDERFYLAADDHEYTARLVSAGGHIYLCATSEVIDVETSWHHRPVASRPWVSPQADERRLYYSVRNETSIMAKRCTRPWLYVLNRECYLVFLVLLSLVKDRAPRNLLSRLALIRKAIHDGKTGRLGIATLGNPNESGGAWTSRSIVPKRSAPCSIGQFGRWLSPRSGRQLAEYTETISRKKQLKWFFWARPNAYFLIIRVLRLAGKTGLPIRQLLPSGALRADRIVDKTTELVIEGFERSGNTFAEVAFRLAQGRPVNIAHHLHVPAQIIYACRRRIPVMVLIRRPRDAVASDVIRGGDDKAIYARLADWVNFHQSLLPFRNDLVLARFEEVISDFGKVVKRINEKFGTKFNLFVHTEENIAAVFREIEALHLLEDDDRVRAAAGQIVETMVARPSEIREGKKREILRRLDRERYQDLLARAEAIYRAWVPGS